MDQGDKRRKKGTREQGQGSRRCCMAEVVTSLKGLRAMDKLMLAQGCPEGTAGHGGPMLEQKRQVRRKSSRQTRLCPDPVPPSPKGSRVTCGNNKGSGCQEGAKRSGVWEGERKGIFPSI